MTEQDKNENGSKDLIDAGMNLRPARINQGGRVSVPDAWDGTQIALILISITGVVGLVVGLFMGLMPSSANPYSRDAFALASEATRHANGQFLAVIGAILAVGTWITLAVRSKA